MTDPKIGTRNADGSIATFPTQTLSGASYSREMEVMRGASLPPMVFLDATRFVVLDIFTPQGFDRQAEVEKLRGSNRNVPVTTSRRMASESEVPGN